MQVHEPKKVRFCLVLDSIPWTCPPTGQQSSDPLLLTLGATFTWADAGALIDTFHPRGPLDKAGFKAGKMIGFSMQGRGCHNKKKKTRSVQYAL